MKEIDDNLLTEFLEGKLDEPANREIENWYDASEENRRRLEALYFVLFAGDRLRAAASVNTDQSFRSLQRRTELRRTKTRPQWRQIAARYAAILVAGVIVAGMYLYQNRPDDRICTVSAERSDCSVTLPDGSVIRLTRSSQLNYPASFDHRDLHSFLHDALPISSPAKPFSKSASATARRSPSPRSTTPKSWSAEPNST